MGMNISDVAQIAVLETSELEVADLCLRSPKSEIDDIRDAHRENIVYDLLSDAFKQRDEELINRDGDRSEEDALITFAKNLVAETGYIQHKASQYQAANEVDTSEMPDLDFIIDTVRNRMPLVIDKIKNFEPEELDEDSFVEYTIEDDRQSRLDYLEADFEAHLGSQEPDLDDL